MTDTAIKQAIRAFLIDHASAPEGYVRAIENCFQGIPTDAVETDYGAPFTAAQFYLYGPEIAAQLDREAAA